MPKLYFKYGTMGSSKSAQALMTKFNYEQRGFNVLLIKPCIDNRSDTNGKTYIASRIGLKSEAFTFKNTDNLIEFFKVKKQQQNYNVIIVDEAQFCTKNQIENLKDLSILVPVLCYGLKTNFKTELFEGSKRLLEIADSITEIKQVCRCGSKAIINARIINGLICDSGNEIEIGADEKYEAMCYTCYKNRLKKQRLNLN